MPALPLDRSACSPVCRPHTKQESESAPLALRGPELPEGRVAPGEARCSDTQDNTDAARLKVKHHRVRVPSQSQVCLTERRNYVAKHPIRTPNPGF